MTRAPHGLDLEHAADAIPEWGFLAEPGAPRGIGPGYLLVALRDQPTLAHFDPESVRFWMSRDGRGQPYRIDRWTPMPVQEEVSWGPITIVDRLRATNEFLTFGGAVSAGREDETVVAVFVSPAPLLRRGGHSQGWDLGAQSLGGHFRRLVAVAGQDRGFEAAVARAAPLVRYAAFIADQVEHGRSSELLRESDPAAWRMFLAEAHRLEAAEPARWREGQALLETARRSMRLPR
jgi:hypothetical protein